MDNPASTSDVTNRWLPFREGESAVAQTRLDDAWRLLRRLVPGLAARLPDPADPATETPERRDLRAEVVRILAEAVIRVLEQRRRGGAAVRRTSAALDDGSTQREYVESPETRSLYFTDAELASVSPDPSDDAPRAFSVMPS